MGAVGAAALLTTVHIFFVPSSFANKDIVLVPHNAVGKEKSKYSLHSTKPFCSWVIRQAASIGQLCSYWGAYSLYPTPEPLWENEQPHQASLLGLSNICIWPAE